MKFFPTTVIKIVQETNDSYSFLLEIPAGYTWKAGQHAAWQLQGYPWTRRTGIRGFLRLRRPRKTDA